MGSYLIKVLQINAENFGGGGISTIIWRLMEQLKAKNVQMSYISQKENLDDRYVREIEEQGGRIHYIKVSSNLVIRYFDRYKKVYQVIQNSDYDIIHINGNEPMGIISYVIAARRCKNCKIVVHAHSTKFMNGGFLLIKKALKNFFQKILVRETDCFLACSTEAAKFMYGKEAYKAAIIKNGLEFSKYTFDNCARNKLRNKYKVKNKMIIGHIGRFVYAKNHEFIIDVFEEIRRVNLYCELWLIGENCGSGYEAVYKKAERKGLLEKVRFIGNTDKIREYLSAMDVLLFPSRFEGLPLVLVEAQVNKLPVVCSNTITNEAVFSKRVLKLPLSASLREWSDSVLKMGSIKRDEIYSVETFESEFDITCVAEKVLREYESLVM